MLARNCRLSERRGAAVTAEQCNVFPLQNGGFSCPVLGNISSSGPDWPPEHRHKEEKGWRGRTHDWRGGRNSIAILAIAILRLPVEGTAWSPPRLVPGSRACLAQASSWSHPSGIGIRAQGGVPLAGCIQDGRAIVQGCLN